MKTIKRSLIDRFIIAVTALVLVVNQENFAVAGSSRVAWLSGWRDGRAASWDGLTGVSGIHCDPQIAS